MENIISERCIIENIRLEVHGGEYQIGHHGDKDWNRTSRNLAMLEPILFVK